MPVHGRESFEEWARARQQRLVRSAYLMTGDFHRAEDLVQEVLTSGSGERGAVGHRGSPRPTTRLDRD
ncbi:hypothetical protein BH09ACT12_BH09ACT12_25280 [soil metagenome]